MQLLFHEVPDQKIMRWGYGMEYVNYKISGFSSLQQVLTCSLTFITWESSKHVKLNRTSVSPPWVAFSMFLPPKPITLLPNLTENEFQPNVHLLTVSISNIHLFLWLLTVAQHTPKISKNKTEKNFTGESLWRKFSKQQFLQNWRVPFPVSCNKHPVPEGRAPSIEQSITHVSQKSLGICKSNLCYVAPSVLLLLGQENARPSSRTLTAGISEKFPIMRVHGWTMMFWMNKQATPKHHLPITRILWP